MTDAALWIDPARMGGQVCVSGTRIPATVIADYVWAGEDPRDGASYDITARQTLCACWWVAFHGGPEWHKRWGQWAETAQLVLWNNASLPNWPPTKDDQ